MAGDRKQKYKWVKGFSKVSQNPATYEKRWYLPCQGWGRGFESHRPLQFHPRAGGEHEGRGRGNQVGTRIIPARAGNTPIPAHDDCRPSDHPRAGGEHQIKAGSVSLTYGSSPRGRGTHRLRGSDKYGLRIIPARAGNTLARLCGPRSPSDHPRAGGEHSDGSVSSYQRNGSSPRGRGTLMRECRPTIRLRIIPARAGNTSVYRRGSGCDPDHPRAGGEHTAIRKKLDQVAGSSPRGRGTPPFAFC